jgi:hypothetical protein
VRDSPWETQYNSWIPNPRQFTDFTAMVRAFRDAGVRTVVWVTRRRTRVAWRGGAGAGRSTASAT